MGIRTGAEGPSHQPQPTAWWIPFHPTGSHFTLQWFLEIPSCKDQSHHVLQLAAGGNNGHYSFILHYADMKKKKKNHSISKNYQIISAALKPITKDANKWMFVVLRGKGRGGEYRGEGEQVAVRASNSEKEPHFFSAAFRPSLKSYFSPSFPVLL